VATGRSGLCVAAEQPNYAFKRTAGRGFDVSCSLVGPRPLNAALAAGGVAS
jgi:hypothetical protein